MKNSITLSWLIALCFGLVAFRPLASVSVSLDERVSVLLPTQPQETAMPAPAKLLSAKDAFGTYIIITSPLEKDFQGAERKQYYDSVIEGALGSGNGKLGGRSTFVLGGYEGSDFTASAVRPDNQQIMLVFVRCMIIDKKSYVLQFIPADSNKGAEAQRKQFFESITLKPVVK
jgi:hypothetical protein